MISVNEAKQLVIENTTTLPSKKIALNDALGCVLATDVTAPVDHPIFDQTAVDGYAVKYEDVASGTTTLNVTHEIPAGAPPAVELKSGEAHRIFTGAVIPPGATAVAMQEDTTAENGQVTINKADLPDGANIRRKGEQIKEGAVALEKGARINAGAIGFLASMGIQEVVVIDTPAVGVVTTGSEFAESSADLEQGKIYESNSGMLVAALAEAGFKGEGLTCIDDPELLKKAFEEYSEKHDLLLITGGVSVGKYDFTRPTLEALGYEVVFHKVNQKPGKPLLFARKGNKLAFGLPGNPRASLICLYQYVLPALNRMAGMTNYQSPTVRLPLTLDLRKRDNKTHFVSARFHKDGVEPLGKQLSHMLQSMAAAQALIVFEEAEKHIEKGSIVEVALLPQSPWS